MELYTGTLLFRTHEHLEHLVLMVGNKQPAGSSIISMIIITSIIVSASLLFVLSVVCRRKF